MMHNSNQGLFLTAIMQNSGAAGAAIAPARRPLSTMSGRRKSIGRRSRLAVLSVVFGAAIVAGSDISSSQTTRATISTATPSYTLGALDKIRLKVLEWRPSRNEVYEWQALNDAYTVGSSGSLSLPLIGEVPAAGDTTEELAHKIGQQLKSRMGLASVPDVAVEMVAYRPFYIVGDVENPGGYPGRPDLSVLQAVSLAGGMFRKQDRALRVGRELIAGGGQHEMLDQEEITLVARKARLEAELKGEPNVAFPRGSFANRVAAAAIRLESTIFDARRQVRDNQMSALKELSAFLEAEEKSIRERIEQHSKNVALAHEEMASVTRLMERQLTTEPRKLSAQRTIFQLEGDGLRLASDLNRAQKDIAANRAAILELSSRTTSEITNELLATQSRLTTVSLTKSTNGQLLVDSAATTPQPSAAAPIKFSIVRTRAGSAPVEFEATEHTIVEPGDTIKVDAARFLDAHHLLTRILDNPRKGITEINASDD